MDITRILRTVGMGFCLCALFLCVLCACSVKTLVPVNEFDENGRLVRTTWESMQTSREALWAEVEGSRIANPKPITTITQYDRDGKVLSTAEVYGEVNRRPTQQLRHPEAEIAKSALRYGAYGFAVDRIVDGFESLIGRAGGNYGDGAFSGDYRNNNQSGFADHNAGEAAAFTFDIDAHEYKPDNRRYAPDQITIGDSNDDSTFDLSPKIDNSQKEDPVVDLF